MDLGGVLKALLYQWGTDRKVIVFSPFTQNRCFFHGI